MQIKALITALGLLATTCSSSWSQDAVPLTREIPVGKGHSAEAAVSGSQVLAPNLEFYTLAPCRAVDTRAEVPLYSGSRRTLQIAGVCGVPATAASVAVNVTVVGPTATGHVKLWPADLPEPATSTINFGPAMTRANNAMAALGTDGSGGLAAKAYLTDSGSVHLIVDITGYMAAVPVQCPSGGLLIFGVNPLSGSVGSTMIITGQSFATNVQVLFGDLSNGSSAPILSSSSTSVTVRVPVPPPGFTFSTEPCDANGDGIPSGTRNVPTPITVNVRNLDGTGCVATLSNAFTLNPVSTVCTGDNSTPQGSHFS